MRAITRCTGGQLASPSRSPLAPSGLTVIASRRRPDGQLLQPFGQPFELLDCAEFVQAVNSDLNRLGVVFGDTVNVFGVTHLASPCITVPVRRRPCRPPPRRGRNGIKARRMGGVLIQLRFLRKAPFTTKQIGNSGLVP